MSSENAARAQSEVLGASEGTCWLIFSCRTRFLNIGLRGHDGDFLLGG